MGKHENRGSFIKCQCDVSGCPRCAARRQYIADKLLKFCHRAKYQTEIMSDIRRKKNRINNRVYRDNKKIKEIEQSVVENVKRRLTSRPNKGTFRSALEPIFNAE